MSAAASTAATAATAATASRAATASTATGTACPVCRASFRGTIRCSRCGADLGPLMKLVAAAWSLRQQARWALGCGGFEEAARLARDAADLHAGGASRDLLLLTAICAASPAA